MKKYESIIQRARSRNRCFLPYISDADKILGSIAISIRRFKRVGLLITIDGGSFDFSEEQQKEFRNYLENVLNDIASKGYHEKLRISRSFVTVAVYDGDEQTVLPAMLDILGCKVATS